MTEFEEFAYALLDQLSVELNEEKEITNSKTKADQAFASKIKFEDIESICNRLFSDMSKKITEFTGISVSQTRVEFPELVEFKRLKGRKVYPTKESAIYLNKFILSSYPQIILYKQGEPYESRFDQVNSGYIGALKMTILEEQIHSIQNNLYNINKDAVSEVNAISEELAKIILNLDDAAIKNLYNYLQLPEVPDEYPIAKRANLFFVLNPDNFIVQVLGPDVMTFTKVTIDPKISEMIPQLLDIYQRWLKPIQAHHAAFTAMEGMAAFAVKNILREDQDFKNYLVTFANSDISSYQVRKSMGTDFTEYVFAKLGHDTYKTLIANPPTTRELKNPESYLNRK